MSRIGLPAIGRRICAIRSPSCVTGGRLLGIDKDYFVIPPEGATLGTAAFRVLAEAPAARVPGPGDERRAQSGDLRRALARPSGDRVLRYAHRVRAVVAGGRSPRRSSRARRRDRELARPALR